VYRLLALWGVLSWATVVVGQQAGRVGSGPLTLSECVNLALQRNPSLESARQNARAARAAFVQTRSQLFPTALLTGSYAAARSRSRTTSFGGFLRTSGGSQYFYQYRAGLNQTIYRTGLFDEVAQSKAHARASTYEAQDARRQLVLSVAENYYSLLASRRLLEVAEDTVRVAGENLALMQARVEAGSAAPVEVLPMRTSLARARADLIAAQATAEVAVASLRAVLGLPTGQDLQVVDVLAEQAVQVDPKEALARALQRRPDYLAVQQTVAAARAARSIARAARWPTLTVDGSLAHDVFEDRPADIWSFNAQVSYPLFDAGSTKAAETEAEANYRSALAAQQELELQIGLEIEQAYAAVRQGIERIRAADAAEREATASLEAARARLQEGVAIAIEVSTAEETLAQTRAEHVQAIYDYNLALAQLQAATGS